MIKEIIAAISFAGFLIGMIIASKTKEELRPGKKYFKFAKKTILILSALFLLNYIQVSWVLLLAGGVIGYFIRKPLSFYGTALGVATLTPLINITGAFTFLFGLVEGTLQLKEENKKTILIALALFFGTYTAFRIINMEIMANAAAGAMLVEAFRKK
ncbi:MAG: hypothetical protein QW404_01275 [Candidatus Nanoarchaeia archaeon]